MMWTSCKPYSCPPQINDAHAQVFSGQHTNASGGTDSMDKSLSLSAEGFAFDSPEMGAGQACFGKYLYAFTWELDVVSANNANADFAHTLTVTGLQLPKGAALTFDAGAGIPAATSAVPEPSPLVMSLLGLAVAAGVAFRHRQRH